MKLIIVALVMCGVLTSCAGLKSVNESFIKEHSSDKSVLVLYGNKEMSGSYYKFGAQGLLDFAINSAFGSNVSKAMSTLDAVELTDKYLLPKLEKKLGKKITYISRIYNSSDLKKIEKAQKGSFNYDLGAKLGSNFRYAYVLTPLRYGANREYFSVVPTGYPRGAAELVLQLVDLKTNQVLAIQKTAERIEVKGEWKQKPDYTNLVNAGREAFKLNSEIVVDKLFVK